MGIQYDGDCEDQRNRMTNEEVKEYQHKKTYGDDCSRCGAFLDQCTCYDNES